MAKIIDHTKQFGHGKWVEVGTLCTGDINELLHIVAKFLDLDDAKEYAKRYENDRVIHTVVIR